MESIEQIDDGCLRDELGVLGLYRSAFRLCSVKYYILTETPRWLLISFHQHLWFLYHFFAIVIIPHNCVPE